jgi:Leucine-rich repeat (LRR) protein
VDKLAGLHDLDSLNLRGNPLGLAPDLSHMQDLTSLDLSHTGLTVMPKGLLANHGLLSAQLSYNAITQVPIELAQAAAHFTQGFDLRGNPLSAQSLERIAAHFRETGNTLGIDGLTQQPGADDPANGIDMEH